MSTSGNDIIRIRMEAYDYAALDQSAMEIVETAKRTGSIVRVGFPFRPAEKFTPSFRALTLIKSSSTIRNSHAQARYRYRASDGQDDRRSQ